MKKAMKRSSHFGSRAQHSLPSVSSAAFSLPHHAGNESHEGDEGHEGNEEGHEAQGHEGCRGGCPGDEGHEGHEGDEGHEGNEEGHEGHEGNEEVNVIYMGCGSAHSLCWNAADLSGA